METESKSMVFDQVKSMLHQLDLRIASMDDSRPWGGFFVIDEQDSSAFVSHFFPDEDGDSWHLYQKLSPKILIVHPGTRLSWQYHHRRAEIWKCICDEIMVVTSHDDTERHQHTLQYGEVIRLQQGERHRLVGTEMWGIVAEVWKHTQPDHPSDEQDIVRLQDDFGR